MRKRLLFIIIMIAATRAYGQVNIDSIYQEGAEWTEEYSWNHGAGVYDEFGYRFRLGHDTIINSRLYNIVYLTGMGGYLIHYYTHDTTLYYSQVNYSKFGAIRTDSNRVYFVFTDTAYHDQRIVDQMTAFYQLGTEYMIYDFNITTGSIIDNDTVTGIDTIILPNGSAAKKYWFTSQYNVAPYWIEGIGSSLSLIPHLAGTLRPSTICYNSPYIENFHFLPYSPSSIYNVVVFCYSGLTETKNINKKNAALTIYPNPTQTDDIFLQEDVETIERCEIYDITGKMMQTALLNKGNRITFAAPNGFYFLKIYYKDKTVVTRSFSKI